MADVALQRRRPGRRGRPGPGPRRSPRERSLSPRTGPGPTASPRAGWRRPRRPDTPLRAALDKLLHSLVVQIKRTPPGRIRPRPKRLPHRRAVRLRKSPRSRPQYEAVGKKPDVTGQSAPGRRCGWPAVPARGRCREAPRPGSGPDNRPAPRPPDSRPSRDRSTCRRPPVSISVDRPLVRAADQRPLDPAVLVAERDLQVKDLLAVALEAEMPRFDDAGVNGTDRDLVDLLPFDAVKSR